MTDQSFKEDLVTWTNEVLDVFIQEHAIAFIDTNTNTPLSPDDPKLIDIKVKLTEIIISRYLSYLTKE